VVSAVQPTGQGGVDVGTWVEEDDLQAADALEAGEGATLLGGEHVSEPDSLEDSLGFMPPQSAEHQTMASDRIAPRTDTRAPSPPDFPDSPTSPRSPTSPVSPSSRRPRQRTARFGTLIPDLAHGGPTGFSIGLGAASPGFVLRPGNISLPANPHRRGRSRSEDPQGILAIMRGVQVHPHPEVLAENQTEEALRDWDQTQARGKRRRSWLEWLRGRREGKIKLGDAEDEEDGCAR